ncbi:hypothetical protein [Caulobacter sp. DWP3-1-3b2]|uniref:hypothetical protein n=1 Tax=Caulobacter sp. DWP3-1-3b2 TaxID=2804643 RepID=UPI003CF2F16A
MQVRVIRALAGALVAALAVTSAQAASPPPASLRSTLIVPVIPKDWFIGTYSIDGVSELGEITPKGQGGGAYIDLIGFSVTPVPAGATLEDAVEGARRATNPRCAQQSKQVIVDSAMPGWGRILFYCLSQTNSDAVLEVNAQAFQIRDGYLFSTWRARRESPAKIAAFVKARQSVGTPVAVQRDATWSFDEKAVALVTPGLSASLFSELAKTEICNLSAGEICASLRAPPEISAPTIAMLHITGTGERTMRQTMTGADGKPVSDFATRTLAAAKDGAADKPFETLQSISLTDHDWSSSEGVGAALRQPLVGAQSGGGTLIAVDHETKADLATRGRMQAYVVMLSRLIWRGGVTPDREQVILTTPTP